MSYYTYVKKNWKNLYPPAEFARELQAIRATAVAAKRAREQNGVYSLDVELAWAYRKGVEAARKGKAL